MKTSTTSSSNALFVDTWGWLVLADSRDPSHHEVVQIYRPYAGRGLLLTTDFVLNETITRLYARSPFRAAKAFVGKILDAERKGMLLVERIGKQRFESAYKLRMKLQDKPRISFTDLTSFVVMQELGMRTVLTADRHFAQVNLGFSVAP